MSTPDLLRRLVVEPTYACNLRCTHCYVYRSARAAGRMARTGDARPLAFWRQVLAGTPDGIVVHFTGGELFAYSEAFHLLDYTASRFKFTVSTNGTFLDDDACQRLAALCPQYVTISILGTAAVHDAITRVPGSFGKAVRAVECLVRLLPAGQVGANFVLLPDNAGVIPEVIEIAEGLGAGRLMIQLFDPALTRCGISVGLHPVPAYQNLDWPGADLGQLEAQLERLQGGNSGTMPVLMGSCMTPAEIIDYLSGRFDLCQWTCAELFDTLRCSPTGRAYTCTGLDVGSLRTASVLELWESSSYVGFREARRDARLEAGCMGCCKIRRKG